MYSSVKMATCMQTLAWENTTPPTITCTPASSPIQCPNTPVFPTPTVSDTCDHSPKVKADNRNTSVAGVQTCAPPIRTWTARDCSGNTATCSQTVVVEDTTPPTIT